MLVDASPGSPVIVRKSARRSPVHRRVRLDEIHVRGHDGAHEVFVGLYTGRADAEPAGRVPLLRQKLQRLLAAEDLVTGSHDWKAAVALFESFPKDVLFGTPTGDLRVLIVQLLALAPGAVRVLGRLEPDARHGALLAAVPRSSYDARLRDAIGELARSTTGADQVAVHEVLGEGDHVRLHLALHAEHGLPDLDLAKLEQGVAALSRTWDDRLRDALVARHGDERGRLLHARWAGAAAVLLQGSDRSGRRGRRRRRAGAPAASQRRPGCPPANRGRDRRPADPDAIDRGAAG